MHTPAKTLRLALLAVALLVSSSSAQTAPENFGESTSDLFGYLGKVIVRDAEYAFGIEPSYGDELNVFKSMNGWIYPLTTLQLPMSVEQMTVSESYAYILHPQDGGDYPSLTIVDIQDPANPVIQFHGELTIGDQNWEQYFGMAVADGFLWLGIDGEPHVYDVTNPYQPAYRGHGDWVSVLQGNPTELLVIRGGLVYVATRHIVDLEEYNPAIATYHVDPAANPPVQPWNPQVFEPVAFSILDQYNKQVMALAVGDRPELFISISTFTEPQTASQVLRMACNNDGTLSYLDQLHAHDTDHYWMLHMEAEGNYLYATSAEVGVFAIDISDPTTMTVGEVWSGADGYMAVFADWVVGGSKATPRITDQPVTATTGVQSWNSPHPTLPERYVWNFVWYTEQWTDPWLDQVLIYSSTGDCSVQVPIQLPGSNPAVTATCEYDPVRDEFKHHLQITQRECYQGCSFSWVGMSTRTSRMAYSLGVLKIKLCAVITPKSNATPALMTPVLSAPSPNPFNPQTTLRFRVPADASSAELTIHDMSGRLLKRLPARTGTDAWQEATWTGRDDSGQRLPSGVYFARLLTDRGAGEVQKLMLIK